MGANFEIASAYAPIKKDGCCHSSASNLGSEDEGRRAVDCKPQRWGSQVVRQNIRYLAARERDCQHQHEPDGSRGGERHAQERGGGGGVEVEKEIILESNAWSGSLDRRAYLSWRWHVEVPLGMFPVVGLVCRCLWWLQ